MMRTHCAGRLLQGLRDCEGTQPRLAFGSGLPEYMVVSERSVSSRRDLIDGPPLDEVVTNSSLVTTSRDLLMDRLPAMLRLHQDVFSGQAVEAGYFGGLEQETLLGFLEDSTYLPIFALDRESDAPQMLAVFAPKASSLSRLDWVNPIAHSALMMHSAPGTPTCFPVVITSTGSGLGLMEVVLEIGASHTLLGMTTPTAQVMFECSSVSIHYTPKIIDRVLSRLGIHAARTSIEATVATEV